MMNCSRFVGRAVRSQLRVNSTRRFASGDSGAAAAALKTRPLVKAPLELTGAVGTYTNALWSAANEKGQKDQVEKDAKTFVAALDNKEFKQFIENPFIPKDERLKGLQTIMTKLKFSEVSQNFMRVCVFVYFRINLAAFVVIFRSNLFFVFVFLFCLDSFCCFCDNVETFN
jgi:hypothetical protein